MCSADWLAAGQDVEVYFSLVFALNANTGLLFTFSQLELVISFAKFTRNLAKSSAVSKL